MQPTQRWTSNTDARAGRFLVVGESLVDVTCGTQAVPRAAPGGSALNVAVGLARLDRPTTLATQLGDDPYGALLRRHLGASGVEVMALPPPGPTGVATADVDAAGHATYTFDLRWNVAEVGIPTGHDLLHVGSLGAVLPPGADAVLASVRRARQAGVAVSLDPNLRPALTPNVIQVRERVLALASEADIVKLSDEDAELLFETTSAEVVVTALLALGVRLVALTCGSRGAALASPDGWVNVAAESVTVSDTIGAGDSFMAALLAGIHTPGRLRPAELDRLGRAACAAAAVTCSRPSADPPWSAELASRRISSLPGASKASSDS